MISVIRKPLILNPQFQFNSEELSPSIFICRSWMSSSVDNPNPVLKLNFDRIAGLRLVRFPLLCRFYPVIIWGEIKGRRTAVSIDKSRSGHYLNRLCGRSDGINQHSARYDSLSKTPSFNHQEVLFGVGALVVGRKIQFDIGT